MRADHTTLTDAEREALTEVEMAELRLASQGRLTAATTAAVRDIVAARVAEARADERERDALRDERNHWIGEAKKYERLWKWADENGARWLRERNEAREALARVEALADEWERESPVWLDPVGGPVTELRAALRGGDA